MPSLELWVIYNKITGRVDIIKSKRMASRIASTYNKLFRLLNSEEKTICEDADTFFSGRKINKEDIHFNWTMDLVDKMVLFKRFFRNENVE